MKTMLKANQGIALVVVIIVMVILLSVVGAGLLFSGLTLKTASNLKMGGAALNVADAGIQHALAVIPWGTTYNYSSTGTSVVPTTAFPTSTSSYNYTVKATNNPPAGTNTSTAILTSTGKGPNDTAKRVIVAYIGRSTASWVPPSALYFTGVSNSDKFFDPAGKKFLITGNDTNYDGTTPTTPASSIPGIGTNDAALTSNVISTLISGGEQSLVQGLGYSPNPLTPSVRTVTSNFDISQLAQTFYNYLTTPTLPSTCPPLCANGFRVTTADCPTPLPATRPVPDPCILGTDAAPQITYLQAGSDHIHINGNVTGSGVLVLDGATHLQGTFNFHGLVIVKEPPTPTGCGDTGCDDSDADQTSRLRFRMKTNAKIFGSLLAGPNGGDLRFDIKDSSGVYYSSQAINMVNTRWGTCCLPQPAKVIAWQEVMQ